MSYIAWTLTAKEAVHHPGVQRLKVAVPCEGWMSHKNYRGPRDPNKGGCKRPARWRFSPILVVSMPAEGGNLCFSHLIYTGVCGNMDEEQRTREWLEKYREGSL